MIFDKKLKPVFFLEEQTGTHLIFGSKSYELIESLYVNPNLKDVISAILWNYYIFLSNDLLSPFDYERWRRLYAAIHQVSELVVSPLDNIVRTKPETANLSFGKGATTVKIVKEDADSPVYITLSSDALLETIPPPKQPARVIGVIHQGRASAGDGAGSEA